jgi:Flp pilus assembly protein TadD
LGDYGRSDAYFAEAVEIHPNDRFARERWAESLDKQGRSREAASQWVAAVEIDRNDPGLRQALADAYLKLGMAKEARTQIDEAIFLDPTRSQDYRRHLEEMTGTKE